MLALEFPPISHLVEWPDIWLKGNDLFAINKVVLGFFIATILSAIVMLVGGRRQALVPTGMQNVAESAIDFIRTQVVLQTMGPDGMAWIPLLLTLFYRKMPSLITEGHVFIAQAPLYRIQKGSRIQYAYSDDEQQKMLAELGGMKGVTMNRYKGLGEMTAEQLSDTTMKPGLRTLLKVTVEDAGRANELFQILMGEEVEPRRQYIQEHAVEVTNLDI